MRKLTKALAFTAIAQLAIPIAAAADQVLLRNGDRLTGSVISSSPTEIVIETELAGRITLQPASISQVTPAVKPHSGPTWHGAISVGADLSRGNSETRSVSSIGKLTRLGVHDRLGVFGTYLFSGVGGGDAAVTTIRSARGGLRYDHDVLERVYAFGFGDAENDPLQLLELRTVNGGGGGVHLIKTPTTQLNVFAGASYARDAYTSVTTTTDTTTTTPTTTDPPVTTPGQGGTPPGQGGTPPGRARVQPTRTGTPPGVVRTSLSRNVGEMLFGHDFAHQISDGMGVSESMTIFPAFSELEDYRVSFDFSLWAQLTGWLQWNLTVSDRYLHIPPSGGAVQNDMYVNTGLAITFGRGDADAYAGSDGRRPRR